MSRVEDLHFDKTCRLEPAFHGRRRLSDGFYCGPDKPGGHNSSRLIGQFGERSPQVAAERSISEYSKFFLDPAAAQKLANGFLYHSCDAEMRENQSNQRYSTQLLCTVS